MDTRLTDAGSAPTKRSTLRRLLVAIVSAGMLATMLVVVPGVGDGAARAADGRLFDPGQIVSDAVFFDGGAMSSGEVQAFLQAQVPRCTSTYACLTTFRQNTPSMPAQAGRCNAYTGLAAESAAEIIARVGQACGISQKAMLTLVQKEMTLVTLSNPSQARFDHATGFGCPDTAACDPAVAGFFYQIYYAARQFKIYANNPGSFNYRAGQVNNVLFHPNRACGSSPVYIANLATAGLYNYTPYQPNAAALANMYGTGDACSSYGNRNFFRIFSDWFGSPTVGTSLIQAVGSADIFLVSGTVKYRIPTPEMLSSYSVLGGVARVSASLPGLYTTGRDASNIIRSPGGAIYFHDARIRLPMGSCDLVVDYGGSCEPDGYTQLTDYQINQFVPGPSIGQLYATTSGARYVVDDGIKREILDDRAQAAASITTGSYVRLTESGLSGLVLGAPIVRDSVFIRDRVSSQYYFYGSGRLQSIPQGRELTVGAPAREQGSLWSASLARLDGSTDPFTGVVTVGGASAILNSNSRIPWVSGLPPLSGPASVISAELAASYPTQSVTVGSLLKGATSPTISLLAQSGLRPLNDWNTFRALNAASGAGWITIPDAAMSRITPGAVVMQPGSLVRSAGDPRVYLVDGTSRLIYVDSFAVSGAAGIAGVQTASDSVVASYTTTGAILGYALACGGSTWLSAGGAIHAMSSEVQASFGLAPLSLESSTCALLPRGRAASSFIRTPEGTIFQMAGGQKRPIATLARYLALDPSGSAFINVDQQFASRFPTGAAA